MAEETNDYPIADGHGPLQDGRYNLGTFIGKLSDLTFAHDFALAVRHANEGNADAIVCVESWFQPADEELAKYGIHPARIPYLGRCTDKTFLLYTVLKEKAPEVFV